MKHKRDETKEASYKILAYLMDNPEAQDTLEGIVDWWLIQQEIKRNVVLVRIAVDGLIHKGFLIERHGDDTGKYYQVNREKMSEISTLLEMR